MAGADMDDRPLSPVYLDNEPVDLDDSKPAVAQIVAAQGKRRNVRVVRLNSRFDMEGSPLGPDDVIDRAEVTPVYLRSIESTPVPESAPGTPGPQPGERKPAQPPTPLPDRGGPEDAPAGPAPPIDPDPTLRDVERPRGSPAEGQVE
ncbi:MAG: hypothetical protein ABR586_03890 [Thermoplasmatota archaeon]